MKTVVLFLLLALLAGCEKQAALFRLANAPGQIEASAPLAYEVSLSPCTTEDVTSPEARRALIMAAWRPLIDGFEEAHQAFCELLTDSPTCKEESPSP